MVTSAVRRELVTRNQAEIHKVGRLSASSRAYITRNTRLFGARRVIAATKTIAGRNAPAGQPKPKSTVQVVGSAPDGFGKVVSWHPDDAGLALVVFLNAGDYLGVMISGVGKTDTIELVSATGIGSFAEETKNKGVGSLIGVVAAGATVAATAFGAPELAPVIGAAEKFAKEQFEEKKVKTKRRDAFGEDPGTGHHARQEGGVIVSLPEAGQIFYSGNSDHEERWIKEPGTRDDAHRPDHVKNAYFLRMKGDKRVAHEAGDVIIAPWDHDFTDNFGYYRLSLLMKRGSGTFPPVVVD